MTAQLNPHHWPDEPDFNVEAAEAVTKALLALDDDEALMLGRILIADAVHYELVSKRGELSAAIDADARERASVMQEGLARAAVAKSRAGQDADVELGAMVELAKAFDFNEDQRKEYARRQRRDLATGRFAESHVRMGYDSDAKPLSREHAKQFGIPEAPKTMSSADRAKFQQSYLQLRDLIGPYTRMPAGDALLHLTVRHANGSERTVLAGIPTNGESLPLGQHLRQGEHVASASVSVVPTPGAGGAVYDALAYAGAPRAGATIGGMTNGGALDPERVHQFGDKLDERYEQDDFIPSNRAFRNLEHGSKLLNESLGDAAPRKLKFALGVGEHVGRLGPEAQRVIGPSADRAAYRYRGTERTPSRSLGAALESIRRDPRISPADKREAMLHGTETDVGWNPSGVLSYFRAQLPTVDLNTLQLKSGNVPPSRGIIINSRGQVAHESVGFGDDWYLPFNLRNLKDLRGGEYIRTRTWGGPTTEDLYTGLMSGARAMTVVSHNGVYTIDFANDLRGGRRFNDKAAAMVGRYGHLIDAVRSGQVETGGIHPSRLSELEEKAGRSFDEEEEPEAYRGELERLKARERKRPTLSHDQQAEATLEFFQGLAERSSDGSAQVSNPDELVRAFAVQAANKKYAAAAGEARKHGQGEAFRADPNQSLQTYTRREYDALSDPDPVVAGQKVAEALGVRGQLDQAMKRAESTNKAALSPLQLNGEGYKTALDALQEQFPYYIDRIEFHPWTDARGGRDTGYVRPNRNRAAEALSGYFDPLSSRNGQGKVFADSTRHQGRAGLRPYRSEARSAERSERSGSSAGGARAEQKVSPDAERMLRDEADRNLFQAIQQQTTFGPAVKTHPSVENLPGLSRQAIEGFRADPQLAKIAPNLAGLLNMAPDRFEAELVHNRDDMHRRMGAAARENDQLGLLDLHPDVVGAVKNDGRPAQAREVGEHPSDHLDNLHQDFDLGSAFAPSANPSAERVQATYEDHRTIRPLIESGQLPADVGASDFPERARALAGDLRQQRTALRDKIRRGLVPTAANYRAVDRPSEGLIAATQLRRRHEEAIAEQGQVSHAAAAVDPGPTVHREDNLVLPPIPPGISPQEYGDHIAAARAAMMREHREVGGS